MRTVFLTAAFVSILFWSWAVDTDVDRPGNLKTYGTTSPVFTSGNKMNAPNGWEIKDSCGFRTLHVKYTRPKPVGC